MAPAGHRRRHQRSRRLRARRSRQCPVSVRRWAARAVSNSRVPPCACRYLRPAPARRARSAVLSSSGVPALADRRRRHHHRRPGRKFHPYSRRSHCRRARGRRPPCRCPRGRSVPPCSVRSAARAAARATSHTSATQNRRAPVCQPMVRTTTAWFQHAAASSKMPGAFVSRHRRRLHHYKVNSRPRKGASKAFAAIKSAGYGPLPRVSALSSRSSVLPPQRTPLRTTSARSIVIVRLALPAANSGACANVLRHPPRNHSAPARRPPSWWRERAARRRRSNPAPASRSG
jgi:hypothetical protein